MNCQDDAARLWAECERFASATLAPNTSKSYADSWMRFEKWRQEQKRAALPASSETLALWATAMLLRGLKVSTVQMRVSGVVYRHRVRGHSSPLGPEVQKVLSGARRLRHEAPRPKRALTAEQLWKISRLIDTRTARGLRDRAVCVVGFAGGFRRSELRALDLADVQFVPKGLLVRLRWSKTGQHAHGRYVGIFRGQRPETCPVRTLKAWIERRGNQPGPLFPRIERSGVITDQRIGQEGVSGIVKRGVEQIGLDPHHYAGHSLRSGCVTAAAEAGATELAIMQVTGHRTSQMVQRYFRPVSAFSVNPLANVL